MLNCTSNNQLYQGLQIPFYYGILRTFLSSYRGPASPDRTGFGFRGSRLSCSVSDERCLFSMISRELDSAVYLASRPFFTDIVVSAIDSYFARMLSPRVSISVKGSGSPALSESHPRQKENEKNTVPPSAARRSVHGIQLLCSLPKDFLRVSRVLCSKRHHLL